MAILIWMASSSVKANVSDPNAFPLVTYEAHYKVSWRGIDAGESIHKLQRRADGNYHFESRTEPRLAILPYHYVESSDFIWKEGKIIPQHYAYNIHEGKRRKVGNVIFDWKTNKLYNRQLDEPWELDIFDGIQDKITQGLALRQALKSGQTTFTYQVAERDKIKPYTFKIIGPEVLKTKLGILKTLKLEHISQKGHKTILWLALPYDYLPVKMTQNRNGKTVSTGEIVTFSRIS